MLDPKYFVILFLFFLLNSYKSLCVFISDQPLFAVVCMSYLHHASPFVINPGLVDRLCVKCHLTYRAIKCL